MSMRGFLLIIMVVGSLGYITSLVAQEQKAVVTGQLIVASNNKPAPGLTISLAHAKLGRSVSASSDSRGKFTLIGIPIDRDPYYIEIYSRKKLVYRQELKVNSTEIRIPPIYL